MPEIKKQLNLYASQLIPLSLRGMFYILVSLNVLQNLPARYDYLSRFTARAREERDLPISCFVDGGRYITDIDDKYQTIEEYLQTPIDIISEAPTEYKIPRWYNQPHYVEVWVEKSAMRGILDSVINTTGEREVRIVPTGGQESVSFVWKNVQRLRRKQLEGKQIHIRYFGDLDPYGELIELETWNKIWLEPYSMEKIDFKRVGVTNEQRLEFNLIPNTDPVTMRKLEKSPNRDTFIQKYGSLFQIEVDALQPIAPEQFKNILLNCVDEYFDREIHKQNLETAPTEEQILQTANTKVKDLYASLQMRLKDGQED